MDDRQLSSSQNTLLKLIRIALGNEQLSTPETNVKWREVFMESCMQGVNAITFDGIERLHEEIGFDLSSEEDGFQIRMEWIASMVQCEQTYEIHENAISEMAGLFAQHGIDTMVLKGYGLSLNYPVPNHRPCGDIDIWLRGRQKEADTLIEEYKGVTPHKSSHHTIFELNGCEVENHITVIEHDSSPAGARIDKIVTELANKESETIVVGNEKVLIPSAAFNSIFLLTHNAGHFAIEFITLRHLLDWATFVMKYHKVIDWDLLFNFAKRENKDKFLNCQNAICIKHLGFPSEMFPVRESYPNLEKRILFDILHPEFDELAPSMDKHFIKYCYIKTKRLWRNRWKYRIVTHDSFLQSLYHFGMNRIKETKFGIQS